MVCGYTVCQHGQTLESCSIPILSHFPTHSGLSPHYLNSYFCISSFAFDIISCLSIILYYYLKRFSFSLPAFPSLPYPRYLRYNFLRLLNFPKQLFSFPFLFSPFIYCSFPVCHLVISFCIVVIG